MPANCFAFPVRVGRKDQFVVVFQGVNNGLDMLFTVVRDFPFHVEIIVWQDRSILGGQVPNVAVGGQNCVVLSEVSVYFLCLSRGFDDDNGHENPFLQTGILVAEDVVTAEGMSMQRKIFDENLPGPSHDA